MIMYSSGSTLKLCSFTYQKVVACTALSTVVLLPHKQKDKSQSRSNLQLVYYRRRLLHARQPSTMARRPCSSSYLPLRPHLLLSEVAAGGSRQQIIYLESKDVGICNCSTAGPLLAQQIDMCTCQPSIIRGKRKTNAKY